ncbi:MAG: histidine kinase [Bdellovibrionaceae bacterium]|nr:histidine kinase [Pseudobdellovibrionaceae bacterium]
MPALKARFLLIGSWDPRLAEIGAVLTDTLSAAAPWTDSEFDVVGVTATSLLEKKFPSFWKEICELSPGARLVAALPEELPAATLLQLHRDHAPFRVLKTTSFEEAEAVLYEALEAASRLRQDRAVEKLLQEQERTLETLREELETRVEKRTRMLAESRHNLHLRNTRLEGLRKALMAVQEASSLGEMEKSLTESLASLAEISWIRIVSTPQDEEFARQVTAMDGFTWRIVPLWRHQEKIGSVFYMRPKDRPFRRDDHDFLDKVSEGVSLALDRMMKLSEAENLKEQWETTFAAISDPVAIIDRSYNVVQTNTAGGGEATCHQRFFQRDTPCPGCRRGESFLLQEGDREWQVHSQLLSLDPQSEPYYVNLYTDVTERRRMERRILESAKMAEIGTIGSSIAHELNNPLGGVLNFAQLLRMDLAPDHPFQEDLKAIEAGAQRCKEIVENLLGFTRVPRADEIREVDLREVARRSMKIVELRSKSLGIEIRLQESPRSWLVRGHLNLLSQALKNLLERAIDAVLLRREKETGHRGWIEISLDNEMSAEGREIFTLTLRDSGTGESPTAGRHGLALQISSQILLDQDARLEISAPSSPDSWAKISFSRPVLRS